MTELTIDQALQQAVEAHKAGQVQEADRLYTASLKAQPKHPDANHNMAVLAVGVGKVWEALPFFKTALETNPAKAQFWLSYIDTLIRLNKLADAKAVFDQAKSKGAKGDGFAQLEQRLKEADQSSSLDIAVQLRDSGKFNQAIDLLKGETSQFPENAELLTLLSHCYLLADQLVEAKLYLGKAKKIAPNNAAVGWNIARLSLKERKPLEALNVARDTSRRFPDDVEGMGVLGACLRANGEVVESLKVLNRAIELNSDYAEAFVSRGLIRLGQENKAEALSDLELAHRLKPHIKQIWDLVIGLKLEMQDYSDAILILINMIDLDPENEKLLTALALCYQHLEDFDSAIGAYKKALSVKPDNVVVQTNLGSALKQKGKLDEAIEAYSKALTIKPDYAEAKHNLAEILKIYSPKNNSHNPLIDLDNKIKTKHSKHMLPKIDQELAAYTLNLLSELQSADKNLSTKYSQIYRRNNVDLNCKRHSQTFKEKEIIPEFCFSCYKVQVDVTTVLDLIRLAALFYELEFESDLTRKCLIELRPNIPGSYKGLIYCRGLDQAHSVKTQLDAHLSDIDKNLVTKIKKGCSEFPLAFPEYGEIASSEEEMMQYPQEWQALENEFDTKILISPKSDVDSSLKEFCLSDYLIMQKWIDYAKGIGDPTSQLFFGLPIKYEEIWKIAKDRIRE